MPGHDRTIPEFIATHPDLSDGHRLFYGLLTALSRYGFCWASNAYLAEVSKKTPRRVQQYLEKFKELNLIIVEKEKQSHRLIWTKATYAEKRQHIAAWERANSEIHGMSFQEYFGDEMNFVGGGRNGFHPPIYKVDNILNTKNLKHIEAWPKPSKAPPTPKAIASVSQSTQLKEKTGPIELVRQMSGPPPTPGCQAMVRDTTEMLRDSFKIGSTRYKIHPKDIEYFLGFSPTIIAKAIEIASKESWQGKAIGKIIPYLFKICCNLRKNQ